MRRSILALGTALLLALSLLPTSALAAQPAADEACPDGTESDFGDIEGTEHAESIRCLADLGLTRGVTDGEYRPGEPVRREQMATLLVRLIEDRMGEALPDPEEGNPFTDVADGSEHVDSIRVLAELGIFKGVDETTLDPAGPVTRGQMASLLRRTLSFLHNGEVEPLSAPEDSDEVHFSDVGGAHAGNINALAAAGIIGGYGDGTFGGGDPVRRDQMASLLLRSYVVAVAEGYTGGEEDASEDGSDDQTPPGSGTTPPPGGDPPAEDPVATTIEVDDQFEGLPDIVFVQASIGRTHEVTVTVKDQFDEPFEGEQVFVHRHQHTLGETGDDVADCGSPWVEGVTDDKGEITFEFESPGSSGSALYEYEFFIDPHCDGPSVFVAWHRRSDAHDPPYGNDESGHVLHVFDELAETSIVMIPNTRGGSDVVVFPLDDHGEFWNYTIQLDGMDSFIADLNDELHGVPSGGGLNLLGLPWVEISEEEGGPVYTLNPEVV